MTLARKIATASQAGPNLSVVVLKSQRHSAATVMLTALLDFLYPMLRYLLLIIEPIADILFLNADPFCDSL
jgi:hypothetical protein